MAESKPAAKRPVALNPSEFHILLSLADRSRHGYAIMQEVEARSDGAIRLGPGTLYGTLKRLLAAGMIEETSVGGRDLGKSQRRRRNYRLTSTGRKVATAEAQRLAALVQVARQKRLLKGPAPAAERGGA